MNIIKKYYVRAAFVAMSATSVAGFAACGGFNLVSLDEEQQLGAQIDQEIRANPAQYPLLNSASANAYLQGMVNQIISAPEVQYDGKFPYKLEIIRDDKTVNAFATPGGYIYVYTGLIKMLDNEASMAGVLGHEIAHSELRHGTQAMTKQYGASILLSLILGQNPSQLAEIAGNLVTGLAVLKNSRDAETQADEYSFKYLRSTRWYPGGAALFFEKIQGQSESSVEFLSTHPNPENRVAKMHQRVQDAGYPGPAESNLITAPYQNFKRTLP